jgi:hypothetical protein
MIIVLDDGRRVEVPGKEVVSQTFCEMSDSLWKCNLCPASSKLYKCKTSKSGYANLIKHAQTHCEDGRGTEFYNFVCGKLKIFSFEGGTPKRIKSIFKWVEYIVMSIKPFNTVDDIYLRNLVNDESMISIRTLKKYIHLLILACEDRIKTSLPNRFCIQFDGWTEDSKHFLAVIATWPDSSNVLNYGKALLSFLTLEDGSDLSASAKKDHLLWVLELFGKNMNNIVCIVCDNCSTNRLTAELLKTYMIGCYSHKLSLGSKLILEQYVTLLSKLHRLVLTLKTIKMYVLSSVSADDPQLEFTEFERNRLQLLCTQLEKIDEVTLLLQ